MKPIDHPSVFLGVQIDTSFLSIVTSFVEESSRAFGLHDNQALKLTLASEEIFSYLCKTAEFGQSIEIRCFNTGYHVRAEFLFAVKDMIRSGDYQALLVVGTSNNVAGGIVLRWRGDRTVEFFGPYIF